MTQPTNASRQGLRRAGFAVAIVALAALGLSCGADPGSTPSSAGEQVFSLRCAVCHKPEGPGKVPSSMVIDDAANVIANGRVDKGMPGFGAVLNASQIDQVIAWLRTQQPAGPATTTSPPTT